MKDLTFKFYSVLKNEDAMPYVGAGILIAADGLGGSGSSVHAIDREKFTDLRAEILSGAYGDMTEMSSDFQAYINHIIEPMVDGKDDTSALWASRIVIGRCAYALSEGKFKDADLSSADVRAELAQFISEGLHTIAVNLNLQKGKYAEQLLLPTTLAFIRYKEERNCVIAETLWAGDSRCYALTPSGLKALSKDDEDNSGSITNLFYADNGKVVLNYLRHEIEKPCVLMAVSDGIFDPFDPHDHLGVEHTLLSAIAECNATQELAIKLKEIYDRIHGDDATMAFVPFGFADYADLKKQLEKRTALIEDILSKQREMYSALQVANQSEEEICHYVRSRTGDKYDYIVPQLLEIVENDGNDVAVTPTLREIVETAKNDFGVSAEADRKKVKERNLAELYNYVKSDEVLDNPEIIFDEILAQHHPELNDKAVATAYSMFKSVACELKAHKLEGNELAQLKTALDGKKQILHDSIQNVIRQYREKFDSYWTISDSADEIQKYSKERENVQACLSAWEINDNALLFNWGLQRQEIIKQSQQDLAIKLSDFTRDYKRCTSEINSRKNVTEQLHNKYKKAWDFLFVLVKQDESLIAKIFSPIIVHRYGFDVSDEVYMAELGRGKRDKTVNELKSKKEIIVEEIVRALAANYDKTSVLDGQYNATKLQMFRAYYQLQSNPGSGVKELEKLLADLEAAYTSLI